MHAIRTTVAIVAVAAVAAVARPWPALAQDTLPADVRAAIDKATTDVLEKTGAPSASIAVVRDGAIAYVRAYGLARLDPAMPATPAMRYSIGSISKKGWMFAAGELAMTARDLALWDIATIDQVVLTPASYRAMQTSTLLTNGLASGYGLGVQVSANAGRRQVSHTGEVSGFTAANIIYPDDRAAIAVLTNLDATGASSQIAARIATMLFHAARSDSDAEQALARARSVFEGLQHGRIDRALFTSNANAYFTDAALADFASGVGPLGAAQEFEQTSQSLRGGMTARSFRIKAGATTLRLSTFTVPDGRLEQYQVAPAE